mgnify:FL=1
MIAKRRRWTFYDTVNLWVVISRAFGYVTVLAAIRINDL